MFTIHPLSLLLSTLLLLTTLASAIATANPSTPTPTSTPDPSPPLSTPNPAQAAKLSSFFASLTAQPAYTSIASVIATAIPDSLIESIEDSATATPGQPGGFFFGTGTQNVLTTQAWFTSLPNEVKGYFSSVAAEEKVILGGKKGEGERVVGNVRGRGWIGGLVCVVGFLGVVVWL
ncbi:hypothetical protein E6O75_ATG03247 [Venturia nashicola]|uniref:Uncharacterized protein n=1 Tax=Venturia nashicola TaxID=86259 RepID=A0A4Z1PEM2_9PEZI|nr:hypothetical protein E6O75_ATG03247 [Venturia nashicola]